MAPLTLGVPEILAGHRAVRGVPVGIAPCRSSGDLAFHLDRDLSRMLRTQRYGIHRRRSRGNGDERGESHACRPFTLAAHDVHTSPLPPTEDDLRAAKAPDPA